MKTKVSILLLTLFMVGCNALDLQKNQMRKMTFWGFWCTVNVCGIGYAHTERGPAEHIESEQSAKPPGVD